MGKVVATRDHLEARLRAEPEDWGAVVRASASDSAALTALYRTFGGAVRSFLRRIVPSASIEDADDLCQEVFMRVPKAAPSYRGDASVKSWLFGVAARVARSRARRHAVRRVLFLARPPDPEPDVPDPVRHLDVQRAIDTLPSSQREVLIMTVVEGLSAKEVSAALGIKEKTVWTRLHRARSALRGKIAVDDEEALRA